MKYFKKQLLLILAFFGLMLGAQLSFAKTEVFEQTQAPTSAPKANSSLMGATNASQAQTKKFHFDKIIVDFYAKKITAIGTAQNNKGENIPVFFSGSITPYAQESVNRSYEYEGFFYTKLNKRLQKKYEVTGSLSCPSEDSCSTSYQTHATKRANKPKETKGQFNITKKTSS